MTLATRFFKVWCSSLGDFVFVHGGLGWQGASEMRIFRRKRRGAGKGKRREERRSIEGWVAGLAGLALFFLAGCAPSSLPQPNFIPGAWPRKDFVLSCFAEAGRETDAVCRLTAELMADELGKPVGVRNRAGNQGGDAVNFVAAQKRDGYHWGGFSGEMLTVSVLGLTETSAANWTFFLVAGDPGVLSVPQDSEYQTLEELVEAAKVSARGVKVAVSLPGGLWHVKLLSLESAADVEFRHAHSGEADAVLSSVSEQAERIRKNALRPLAAVEAEAFEISGYGIVPSAADLFPVLAGMRVRQFYGFALPSDTPAGILERIATAFEKTMASEEVRLFCRRRGLIPLGLHGEKADRLARAMESAWVWRLRDLGLTKESPADFGIPRPEAGVSQ